MTKNVIFCADGTWDGPSKDIDGILKSNVLKLFENLAGANAQAGLVDEMERTATYPNGDCYQIAKYIHGVGDSKNPLVKFAEGSTGAGLLARLVRGYTFISRNYRPGDRIYIVGFSRGAYTARALGGLIAGKGLLDWRAMGLSASGDPASYAAGMNAWREYQRDRQAHKAGILEKLAWMAQVIEDDFHNAFGHPPPLKLVSDVPVKAIAVWDTVGAMGIPEYNAEKNERIDVFKFVDLRLSATVESGFHVVSIDEERVDFTPTLWDPRDQGGIEQVLFPGAHADIGGGYEDTGLSDGALQWMLDKLIRVGVQFGDMANYTPDAKGMCHRPWLDPIYIGRTARRHFPPGLLLSQTVVDRINAGLVSIEKANSADYRPGNLTNSYYLMNWSAPAPHVDIAAL